MIVTLSQAPTRRSLMLGGASAAGIAVAIPLYQRRDRFTGDVMTPPEAFGALQAGNLLLIDIRRPDEWERTGIAAGAEPLDMRREDFIEALTTLTGGDLTVPVALICAAGVRSDRIGARLADAGFTRVIDVPEGMLGSGGGPGWLARGLPVATP